MTENEKAATYIGWIPEGCTINPASSRACELGTKSCERRHNPAPDMSKPEHYMWAMEALPMNVSWEFNRNYAEGHNCNIYLPDRRIAYGSYPLDTLAMLYDIEHPSCPRHG